MYYKIVRIHEDKLQSYNTNIPAKYRLEYEIGKKTIPKVGKILVFRNLLNARNWYVWNHHYGELGLFYDFYECEVENPNTQEKLCVLHKNLFETFWKTPSKVDETDTFNIPIGTVTVDSCTLVRKLDIEEVVEAKVSE